MVSCTLILYISRILKASSIRAVVNHCTFLEGPQEGHLLQSDLSLRAAQIKPRVVQARMPNTETPRGPLGKLFPLEQWQVKSQYCCTLFKREQKTGVFELWKLKATP